MKIEEQDKEDVRFGDVQIGDTFMYIGSDYVKTFMYKGDKEAVPEYTNALRLKDGAHGCFQDVTYITITPNSKFVRGL